MLDDYMDHRDLVTIVAEDKTIEKAVLDKNYYYYSAQKDQKSNCKEFLVGLAACELLRGDYSRSESILELLLTLNSKITDQALSFVIGLSYYKVQKHCQAIDYFNSALIIEKSLTKEYLIDIKLLESYTYTRNYTQSIEHFNNNSSKIPDECLSRVLCNIGYCYEQLGQSNKAIDCYKSVSALNSDLSCVCDVWVSILQYNCAGILEKIQQELDKHAENAQEWYEWSYFLGLYYIRQEKYSQATRILKNLCNAPFNKEVYLCCLASVLLTTGNICDSFVCYLKAAALDQSIPEIWYNIAVLYSIVGQKEVQPALLRAKKLDTSNVLPYSIDLNTKVLPIRLNLADFGAVKSLVKKKVKNPVKIKKEVYKKFDIIVPTPIKVSQPITTRQDQVKTEFNIRNNFTHQLCFNFLDFINKKLKTEEYNEVTQAATILAKIGDLPIKRNRA